MLEKVEIFIIIFVLLFILYLVISWSAGGKKSSESPEIASYLFNVRVLIIIIAIVSSILWFLL